MSATITYRRSGRTIRATGTVVEKDRGLTKVKPTRADWGMVWITGKEIEAGQEKPPIRPREKKDKPENPAPRPKPKPKPKTLTLEQITDALAEAVRDHDFTDAAHYLELWRQHREEHLIP